MAHIVKDLDWGIIDIVVNESRVFFQQRWKYDWKRNAALTDWTQTEKRKFHSAVDKQIWASWSNKVKLTVSGTSNFARRFRGVKLPMNLDVRWVLAKEHWNVEAWKVPENVKPHNWVNWGQRKIKLHTSKLKEYNACNKATPRVCKVGFKSVPHEFGHTLGSADEYTSGSPHLPDSNSILNIGKELRTRHFDTIIAEMNKMIPNTTFAVSTVG